MIPKDLKLECIKLKEEGTSVKKIYKEHFLKDSESGGRKPEEVHGSEKGT